MVCLLSKIFCWIEKVKENLHCGIIQREHKAVNYVEPLIVMLLFQIHAHVLKDEANAAKHLQ